MSFVVAGLPRSRTAWCSAYLDAVHDPMAFCNHIGDYWDVVGDQGACDPSFFLFWEEVLRQKSVTLVLIHRPMKEVIDSASVLGIPESMIEFMAGQMAVMRSEYPVIELDYHDLDLQTLWESCKQEPWDKARAMRMDLLQIEQDTSRVKVSESVALDILKGIN